MSNSNLIKIDSRWVDKELIPHLSEKLGDKISMRLYTIKPASTQIDFLSLSSFLAKILPHYVYSIREIEDDIKRKIDRNERETRKSNPTLQEHELSPILISEAQRVRDEAWVEIAYNSRVFFKKRGEDYIGGKYGELLLFALVEGILGCKMIAHKIQHLTNVYDEVKGSDGIFIGEYNGDNALLIGESKIMQSLSEAITNALDSINRYHNNSERTHNMEYELVIARKDEVHYNGDIDELYDRLDPATNTFKEQLLVHPIILMYERAFIKKIQVKATSYKHFNDLITAEIRERVKRKKEVFDLIDKHIKVANLEHAFLDFFLVPVDDVSKFRNAMDNKLL